MILTLLFNGVIALKNIDNLCLNCFEELENGSVCQSCNYDNDTPVGNDYLQPRSELCGRYTVGALVAHESDSAVYMGYDQQFDAVCVIREFLPKGISNRLEGNTDVHVRERFKADYDRMKASFINLWTTVMKLHNLSAVVQTYDVFELNATAYAVTEYMDSITLREFLLRNPDGNILWDKARLMFMPVLTTLEALHANGIVNGGICPDNLVLCRDGKVRLSTINIIEANVADSVLEFTPHEGYTALEQYDNTHKVCPATDIYAFSACIFRALVGQNPPSAVSRETNDKLMIPNSIAEKIPTHIIKALGGSLQVYPEKRTQTVEAFREQLNAAPAVVAASGNPIPKENEPDPIENEKYYKGYPVDDEKDKKKGNGVLVAILVILLIAAVGGGIWAVTTGKLPTGGETTTAETTTELATHVVPDFVSAGYTQSDIQNNAAWNEQFAISFVAEYSTEAEEGVIFKQSVTAGEEVDEGAEIVLTVSKGVETVEVPDVGGLDIEEATKILEEKGFKVSTVEVYNDNGHKAGTVKAEYGMAPAAGEVVAKGEEIILQVYGEEVTTTEAANDNNA